MIPSSEHIKQMLIADPNVDTDKFLPRIGTETGDPNDIFIIHDYGAGQQLTLDLVQNTDMPSVQIRCRSVGYMEGWKAMESVRKSLDGRANESYDGFLYTLIRCINGITFTHFDENQRVHFVSNYDIKRVEC